MKKRSLISLIPLVLASYACIFADDMDDRNNEEFADPIGFPLTIEMASKIALDQNPMACAARAGIAISRAESGIAKAPYLPTIDANVGYTRFQTHFFFPPATTPTPGAPTVSNILGPFNEWFYHIHGKYVLFDSGQTKSKWLSARARQCAAIEEARRTDQQILSDVSDSFYTLLADKETLWYAEQDLVRSNNHLRIAQDRVKSGATPPLDGFRAQLEVANAKLALIRAKSSVRISKGNLNIAMGISPEADIDVVAPASEGFDSSNIDLSLAIDTAIQTRPEINAALQRIQAAQYDIEGAKGAYGPSVVAEGYYGKLDTCFLPQTLDWAYGVTVQIPIFSGYEQHYKVDRARGVKRKGEADYQSLGLSIQQEVWSAHSRLVEAEESFKETKSRLAFAVETHRIAEERYKVGADTIDELLNVQVDLSNAQAQMVEARWHVLMAQTALLRSIGILGDFSSCSDLARGNKAGNNCY